MLKTPKKKRRSLTLLEVMIALSLAAVFLSALTTAFYQISKKRIAAQELKKNYLSIEMVRQKMTRLFAQAAAAESPLFQTGSHPQAVGPVLLVTFHQEVDRDPAFCGDVTGMLYQNAAHQLCFAIWGAKGDPRVDVLLDQIKTLSFSFFDPGKKIWKPNWEKKNPFPPFFKLCWTSVDQPQEMQECAFFFPQNTPITYETRVQTP